MDTVYESLCATVFPLETPRLFDTVPVNIDVVDINVPALLGLDCMDEHSLTPCIITSTLAKRVVKEGKSTEDWSIKLTQASSNNLFTSLELPSLTRSTRAQLRTLHRKFFHSSLNKSFNLIKKV